MKITLKEAERFHGHLGPYLVLGILCGRLAVRRLGCRKYFDLYVKVWGAGKKPRSCIIDGLQLSTGATYGKGNIEKLNGRTIKIKISNRLDKKKIVVRLASGLIQRINRAKTHRDSEILARKLYRENPANLLDIEIVQ